MKFNKFKHIITKIKKISVNLSNLCHLCAICMHAKQKSLALFASSTLRLCFEKSNHKGTQRFHKGTQRVIFLSPQSPLSPLIQVMDIFDLFELTKMKTNNNNAKQSGVQHRIIEQNNKSPPYVMRC
ncbi:MAG: hypothetical protein FWH18_10025 [Marinilabiliaceae bacterium]|nr:hypothetical protein [Marinilabiliaceae bacterium]